MWRGVRGVEQYCINSEINLNLNLKKNKKNLSYKDAQRDEKQDKTWVILASGATSMWKM